MVTMVRRSLDRLLRPQKPLTDEFVDAWGLSRRLRAPREMNDVAPLGER